MKLECRRNLTAFPLAFPDRLPPRTVALPDAHGAHGSVGGADDEQWGPGPRCHESARELSFSFGVDGFTMCGLFVANEDLYNFLGAVVRGNESWNCRVAMSKDRSFYLPVSLPMWGVQEPEHLHLNMHLASVFHVDQGRIIGATIYPIRDRFQFTRPLSTINLHGSVKWFDAHSYNALGAAPRSDSNSSAQGAGFFTVLC